MYNQGGFSREFSFLNFYVVVIIIIFKNFFLIMLNGVYSLDDRVVGIVFLVEFYFYFVVIFRDFFQYFLKYFYRDQKIIFRNREGYY